MSRWDEQANQESIDRAEELNRAAQRRAHKRLERAMAKLEMEDTENEHNSEE